MSLKLGLRNKIRRSRAGGFTGLLDQSFATGATAAYSLRKLKSSATKAVRVREDNGNTEIDIGFSGTLLDEAALLNHCGSANGLVTKWYDQSGNGNDASNSNASEQPQIVSSGTVIKENGEPTLEFDGGDDDLILKDLDLPDITVSAKVQCDDPGGVNSILGSKFNGTASELEFEILSNQYKWKAFDGADHGFSGNFSANSNFVKLQGVYNNNTNEGKLYENNVLLGTEPDVVGPSSFDTGNNYRIGSFNNEGNITRQFNGSILEIIIFNESLSSNNLSKI